MIDAILSQIIDDFNQRDLPTLTERHAVMPEVEGKASVVIGMRRTGKTWYCYQKIQSLIDSGVAKSRILYVNFEDDRLLGFSHHNFQQLLERFYLKFPENIQEVCYLFFDEIQEIDKWEYFIRRLLDQHKVKVYLTGSSAKLLSSEIATQLRGRSISMEMFPFNFRESLSAFDIPLLNPDSMDQSVILQRRLEDYLEIGGFPEVQGLDRPLRTQVLQEYIDIVLLRDIIERHKISNVQVLRQLVSTIIKNPGDLFSVNKFYNTLKSMGVKCGKDSIYNYLEYLLDAYLFFKVPFHTWSERVRQVNPPKIYCIDTGILFASEYCHSRNQGKLLENFVYMALRRRYKQIEYWKSDKGHEVDFYINDPISGPALIQVCASLDDEKTLQRETRALEAGMSFFGLTSGHIITLRDEKDFGDGIYALPARKWALDF